MILYVGITGILCLLIPGQLRVYLRDNLKRRTKNLITRAASKKKNPLNPHPTKLQINSLFRPILEQGGDKLESLERQFRKRLPFRMLVDNYGKIYLLIVFNY